MPLTRYQATLAKLLATNRSPDSYLAGGSALHLEPNSSRYSNDLDYFHDSVERVAKAFEDDQRLLTTSGYDVQIDLHQPGYIRAIVRRQEGATKVEWAHDSAWRFMPTLFNEAVGYQLHPIDLAINKLLALAGRDEPRDFIDVLHIHHKILPLGALCWAAAGKDPGFTPLSLLALLRRRGKYQPEEFQRLQLTRPIDLPALKSDWLEALAAAEKFVRSSPPEEVGCLYFSKGVDRFVEPDLSRTDKKVIPHFGRPGGVLPKISEN